MNARYAHSAERFHKAVDVLAGSPASVQERVADALWEIITLAPAERDDLPKAVNAKLLEYEDEMKEMNDPAKEGSLNIWAVAFRTIKHGKSPDR